MILEKHGGGSIKVWGYISLIETEIPNISQF